MTSEHELHWLAFCYLTGELSSAEQADFEAQLATDQATREALALAVQLHYSAQMAERVPPPVTIKAAAAPHGRRISQFTALACSLVACLLMMFAWFNLPRAQHEILDNTQTDTASQLIAIWSSTNLNVAHPDDTSGTAAEPLSLRHQTLIHQSFLPESNDSVFADSEDLLNEFSPAEQELQEELAVPNWIFSALATADDQDLPDQEHEIQEN